MPDTFRRPGRTLDAFLICSIIAFASVTGAASASADNVCTILADASTGAILKQEGRLRPAGAARLDLQDPDQPDGL
jgi:hypothetical protein